MTHRSAFNLSLRAIAQSALMATIVVASQTAWSQASSPTQEGMTTPPGAPMPAGVAAKNAAVKSVDESLGAPVTRALPERDPLSVRGGLVTHVGSGRPVSEGSRVLRLPGKCSPKTNSLDCVAEAGQAPTGANVSSRVRNSVIGEVGAGRAATEGSGTVKRKEACTPQAGKLTCE